jgi:6-phosphogluconolactonase (cycloisomerase 2 family)
MDIDAAGTMLYTSAGAVGEQDDFQLLAVELPSGDVTLVATIEESQDAPGDITLSPDERHLYVYDQQGSNIGAGIWRVDVDQTSNLRRDGRSGALNRGTSIRGVYR